MLNNKLVRIVEIDVDFCTLTYGQGACTASLSLPGHPRKCFNTFSTCQVREVFDPGVLTLRFVEPRSDFPATPLAFPVLESVSPVTATVNISGSNPDYNGLGRRGTISATLVDFPYGDQTTDKYSNERKSGDAQLDEGGYDPLERGTFFGKLKSRWPHYGDRPMRYIEGHINEDNEFVADVTRHYIITDFEGPDRNGQVTFKGKDILHLADDKKALCPKPSRGQIRFEIFDRFTSDGEPNPEYNPEVELVPEGIGEEYPSEGWATLGREVVTFTRNGDIVTLTGRGMENTEERSHREGTTFQLSYRVSDIRIDDLVEDLLVNYSQVPASFIPKSKWESEVTRWASPLVLDTIITSPEGVQKLISELAVLGVSVWWDDVEQEIGLEVNKFALPEEIVDFSDDANILDIQQEDNDEDRLTQIHFYSVQTDPTGNVNDKNNYDRLLATVDAVAEDQNAYRNPKIREIFCRWVNTGADSVLSINAKRLLGRFNTAPITYTIKIDDKDNSIGLLGVVRLDTRVAQDATGKPTPKLAQVKKKSTRREVGWTDIELQEFFFEGQFRLITPNNTEDYTSAPQEEKDRLAFIIDESEDFFPDGAGAHQFF